MQFLALNKDLAV